MRFCYSTFSSAGSGRIMNVGHRTIHNITVDVPGDLIEDEEAELRRLMAQQ